MCGNAARAAAAWLKHEGRSFPHHLETGFGEVLLGEHVLGQPHGYTARISYEKRPLHMKQIAVDESHNTEGILMAKLIDTGVPHAVVELPWPVLQAAIRRKDQLRDMASFFRWAKEAGHGGTNVTFYSRIEKNVGERPAIESVTFERGVEDLTLACGTGVLAAAVVASGLSTESHSAWPNAGFEVRTPGATIWVESKDFPISLTLVGPANIVFSAKLVSSR
jgi:diaminopimelate epimerase